MVLVLEHTIGADIVHSLLSAKAPEVAAVVAATRARPKVAAYLRTAEPVMYASIKVRGHLRVCVCVGLCVGACVLIACAGSVRCVLLLVAVVCVVEHSVLRLFGRLAWGVCPHRPGQDDHG